MRRENNLIVYGIPENIGTDTEIVNDILNAIAPNGNEIGVVASHNLKRLGRPREDKKPRPLRVTLSHPDDVKSLIRAKNKLKSITALKNYYLKLDETSFQRKLLTDCREKLQARI